MRRLTAEAVSGEKVSVFELRVALKSSESQYDNLTKNRLLQGLDHDSDLIAISPRPSRYTEDSVSIL